ncbi:MAG: hypothetical protein ACTSP5_04760 [Candidatus Heimdallarchaeota archaeon]
MTIKSVEPFVEKANAEGKSLGQIMIEHEAEIQETTEDLSYKG